MSDLSGSTSTGGDLIPLPVKFKRVRAIKPTRNVKASVQHSAASPEWGSAEVLKLLAGLVLRPASRSQCSIDLDYSSSAYWHRHWPVPHAPRAYLDGARGRDVLVEADRRKAFGDAMGGTGFDNPAGIGGGAMVQRCWEIFETDHRTGLMGSGVWIGFNIETLSSLQNICERHPLSAERDALITTIIPSRRTRYLLHPERALAVLRKKLRQSKPRTPARRALNRQLGRLQLRGGTAPVVGDAPPHASYVTILWSRDASIRERQVDRLDGFLRAQRDVPKSLFQTCTVLGWRP